MEPGEEQEREGFLMSLSLASVMGEGLRCQAPPLSQVLLSSSSRPTDRQEDRATRRSVSSSFRSVRNKTVLLSSYADDVPLYTLSPEPPPVLRYQLLPSTAESLRAPGRPPPPCCSTAALETLASSSPSRDTCVASKMETETRECF